MCTKGLNQKEKSFLDYQKRHYNSKVEDERYCWQTKHPLISRKEQELLKELNWGGKGLILEVGCGEGANYYHLKRLFDSIQYFGLDFSAPKIRFAEEQAGDKNARFICGDALHLPFEDSSMPNILCRDLLHHMDPVREYLIQEMWRVLAPGGKLFIIEANFNCLINRLFALLSRKERGLKNSTLSKMQKLILPLDSQASFKMHRSFDLGRAICHYHYGLFWLNSKLFFKIIDWLDKLITAIVQASSFSYIIVCLLKK